MDTSKFKVDEFMKIPISLGLYKSDEILKEIINKGIKNGLSIRRIEEEADIVKKQEAFNEYQRFQLTNKILYLLLAISLMVGMISIYKMLLNHKITKELKKEMHSLKLSYQVDLSIGFYKNYNKNLETSFKYAYMAMEEVKKKII